MNSAGRDQNRRPPWASAAGRRFLDRREAGCRKSFSQSGL